MPQTVHSESIEESDLQCSICVSEFDEPKLLQCGHSFCLNCLMEYSKNDIVGSQKTCPLCRAVFEIPKGGVAGLLDNDYLIQRILEFSNAMKRSSQYISYPCNEKNSKSIQLKKSISGIAVIGNKIYITQSGQSQIHVYDLYNLKESSVTQIPSMKDPQCIVGCPYHKNLYISDHWMDNILKINISGNPSISSWKLKKKHQPRGLSMTLEHTVLVTVQILGMEGESKAVEYSAEGKLLREIRFHRGVDWAYQTLQLFKNQFIVCHGYDTSGHRVCLVNTEGKILKSFGEGRGSENKLNTPCSIAIDEKNKRLCVADYYNSRVVQLNMDLTECQVIYSSPFLHRPTQLCFLPDSDRLLIGENSGNVLIAP